MTKIICVGKIKEKYWKDALEEYKKRLSKYTKLDVIECSDYSNLPISDILEKERQEIEKYTKEKEYLVTLEIDGEEMNSISFSKKMEQVFQTYSTITFVIGGSYGIHEDLKQKANLHLSFSKMTFPHQLFRVLLLEQIYRSYKIQNNESYHK